MHLVLFLLFFVASAVIAAPINKCTDADGRVTFSQTSCGKQDAVERIEVRVHNSGIGLAKEASTDVLKEAEEAAPAARPRAAPVVPSACGSNYSSQEIRKAIIEKRVFVGMTGKDARRSWGSPSTINRSSYGDSQWVYDRGPGSTQYLYVDHNDCVTAWN